MFLSRFLSSFFSSPTTLLPPNGTVLSAPAGSAIELNCSAEVDPKLEGSILRKWSRVDPVSGEKNILESSEETLEIPYLTKDHSGQYLCTVLTELDSAVLVQDLDVIFSAPEVEKTSEQEVVGVLEGKGVQLECRVLSGVPEPEVTWIRRGRGTDKDEVLSSEKYLSLPSSSKEGDDQARFSCVAANEYGSDSKEVRLEVYSKMRFSKQQLGKSEVVATSLEDVRLPCEVEVDARLESETEFKWKKNDAKLTGVKMGADGRSLLLEEVMKTEDSGDYQCLVSNSLESVNRTFSLTVLGEPPEFISTEKNIRLENIIFLEMYCLLIFFFVEASSDLLLLMFRESVANFY